MLPQDRENAGLFGKLCGAFKPRIKKAAPHEADALAADEWAVSLFPDGRRFAFTIVHDADSGYSRRLQPLFEVFDELELKITATVFMFWANWAENGDIWREWNEQGQDNGGFFAPKAVPLTDEKEREFYLRLAAGGHEIGMHTPSDTSDTRHETVRAFEYFKAIFGHYPKVYTEHAGSHNKEAQANEGSNQGSPYYNTDLLNHYGPWIWLDDQWGLPDRRHERFYDLLAANGSPFNASSVKRYGVAKTFLRTGRWKEGDGDGFLRWYSEDNIDLLEKHRGLALVYTHLNEKWLDPETRQMRAAIKDRLRYLASKNGWFVPAGVILDRAQAVVRLKLHQDGEFLEIVNTGDETIEGLTVISNRGRSLRKGDNFWRPQPGGEIVLGTIHSGEALLFTTI
jgi:peptidoglycan/xylan/chitin deacetylase (PgdA/CDA1 family)